HTRWPRDWSSDVCSSDLAMIAAGARRIEAMVVLADGDALCAPCGGCRQRIREFAEPATEIHLCGPDGVRCTVTVGALLPLSFGRSEERRVGEEGRGRGLG